MIYRPWFWQACAIGTLVVISLYWAYQLREYTISSPISIAASRTPEL